MTNEHDFDIVIVEERAFNIATGTESDLSDSRSFSSVLATTARLFSIIIDNMVTLTSWFVRVIQDIKITVTLIMTQALTTEIKLKRILINAISSMTTKFVDEVKLKRVLIIAVMQQIMYNPITIKLKKILIVAVMTMLWSLGDTTITIPRIVIVANMSSGTFYPLWLYDPDELWEMDSQTLTALDYTST